MKKKENKYNSIIERNGRKYRITDKTKYNSYIANGCPPLFSPCCKEFWSEFVEEIKDKKTEDGYTKFVEAVIQVSKEIDEDKKRKK